MRLGYALKKGRNPDGSLFRFVPPRAARADIADLSRFTGWVVSNDPGTMTILLHVQANDSQGQLSGTETLQALIAYPVFQRVRKFSEIAFEPREENPARPTRQALGTNYKAYRTVEEVRLV